MMSEIFDLTPRQKLVLLAAFAFVYFLVTLSVVILLNPPWVRNVCSLLMGLPFWFLFRPLKNWVRRVVVKRRMRRKLEAFWAERMKSHQDQC